MQRTSERSWGKDGHFKDDKIHVHMWSSRGFLSKTLSRNFLECAGVMPSVALIMRWEGDLQAFFKNEITAIPVMKKAPGFYQENVAIVVPP